jgi:hypothetical protein
VSLQRATAEKYARASVREGADDSKGKQGLESKPRRLLKFRTTRSAVTAHDTNRIFLTKGMSQSESKISTTSVPARHYS